MKDRYITVGFPSGKVKLTLWAGTEDEESFPVKGLRNCCKPFVMAYGIRYELTEDEVRFARASLGINVK